MIKLLVSGEEDSIVVCVQNRSVRHFVYIEGEAIKRGVEGFYLKLRVYLCIMVRNFGENSDSASCTESKQKRGRS